MTIATPIRQAGKDEIAGKDEMTDRRVDVQTDAGKAGGEDERVGASGFVIVLANQREASRKRRRRRTSARCSRRPVGRC